MQATRQELASCLALPHLCTERVTIHTAEDCFVAGDKNNPFNLGCIAILSTYDRNLLMSSFFEPEAKLIWVLHRAIALCEENRFAG